jgi:hypothetical protein
LLIALCFYFMAVAAALYPPSPEIKYWPPPLCPGCHSQCIIKECGPESKTPKKKYFGCNNADWRNNKESKCSKMFQWADVTVAEAKAAKEAFFKGNKRAIPPKEENATTTSSPAPSDGPIMAVLQEIKETLGRIEAHLLAAEGYDIQPTLPPAADPPTKKPCFKREE